MTDGFATRAVHVGQDPDPVTGAVVPPLTLATTFVMDAAGTPRAGYDYARSGTPGRTSFESALASLEGGAAALAFPSGLSAEDTLLRVLTRAGDAVVFGGDVYGGTFRLLTAALAHDGRRGVPVDAADLAATAAVIEAERPVVVWVETPSNPLLQIADLAGLASAAHAVGALLVVDNTFASPALQRPLEFGADVVVHSTTKLIGGHSDMTGGAVVTASGAVLSARRTGAGGGTSVIDEVGWLRNAVGAVPGPFDVWLAARGLKTLRLRAMHASASALRLAEHFAARAASGARDVVEVIYPGLAAHPGHALATRQMDAYGTVVSLRCASPELARAVCERTRLFALAVSLGAVESLIEHPASMTHATKKDSPQAVADEIIRLSIGLEDVEDLIADLEQAFA
ncbi:MAG: PLP-dependent transferase [Propioniciclava sp.]|uniref:aminotransferase class I/II-fold pyridoxal phosphate-dependent enzyme n=1 Tax=Propioniciclava sp. TaxID=2038686 RepID=UPI0039E23923